jgi:hypothetical protein
MKKKAIEELLSRRQEINRQLDMLGYARPTPDAGSRAARINNPPKLRRRQLRRVPRRVLRSRRSQPPDKLPSLSNVQLSSMPHVRMIAGVMYL